MVRPTVHIPFYLYIHKSSEQISVPLLSLPEFDERIIFVSLSLATAATETDQDRIQNMFYTAFKSASETFESLFKDNKSFILTVRILFLYRSRLESHAEQRTSA
jgi:hypothetical protein